jgi:hypothetical protein
MPTRWSGAGWPSRSWLRYVLAALLWITADGAKACQICSAGLVVTPGQRLHAADQAVLAVPVIGESRFRVVEVIKGKDAADRMIAEEALGGDETTLRTGKPLLLLRNALAQRWSSIGAIEARYAGWLRRLAANGNTARGRPQAAWPQTTQPSSELTDAEWRERVALVVPYLEDPEPLAAEIAHGEVSRAPYSATHSLKPQLDATTIARWIDDPKLVSRRSTYTLLLGIAGGADDAARLQQRLDAAWESGDAADLAAMLAADLELRGPSRVDWIEKAYFADRSRTLPEINAALLALGVHGDADAAVPRARVIEAYRLFIRERKPMAGRGGVARRALC